MFCLHWNYFSGFGVYWTSGHCFVSSVTFVFVTAFFACTNLPPLQSGALRSRSLFSASVSASVVLGKAYHQLENLLIIIISS